ATAAAAQSEVHPRADRLHREGAPADARARPTPAVVSVEDRQSRSCSPGTRQHRPRSVFVGSSVMEMILQHWGLLDHHLDGVLLSAGLIALFTVAEIRWPASRKGDGRSRIVNIVIGVIVSVFAFLCTVLIAWFAALVWRDGLIGLVVPGWRGGGIAGLVTSVVAYGMVWDFFQYWFHRWQHMSPTLWPSHRVHHSDDSVNTTTALRRSVLALLLLFVFILVPTVIVAGGHQ